MISTHFYFSSSAASDILKQISRRLIQIKKYIYDVLRMSVRFQRNWWFGEYQEMG